MEAKPMNVVVPYMGEIGDDIKEGIAKHLGLSLPDFKKLSWEMGREIRKNHPMDCQCLECIQDD